MIHEMHKKNIRSEDNDNTIDDIDNVKVISDNGNNTISSK